MPLFGFVRYVPDWGNPLDTGSEVLCGPCRLRSHISSSAGDDFAPLFLHSELGVFSSRLVRQVSVHESLPLCTVWVATSLIALTPPTRFSRLPAILQVFVMHHRLTYGIPDGLVYVSRILDERFFPSFSSSMSDSSFSSRSNCCFPPLSLFFALRSFDDNVPRPALTPLTNADTGVPTPCTVTCLPMVVPSMVGFAFEVPSRSLLGPRGLFYFDLTLSYERPFPYPLPVDAPRRGFRLPLWSIYLSVCLSARRSVRNLSIYLSVCLSICPSAIYLSLFKPAI